MNRKSVSLVVLMKFNETNDDDDIVCVSDLQKYDWRMTCGQVYEPFLNSGEISMMVAKMGKDMGNIANAT